MTDTNDLTINQLSLFLSLSLCLYVCVYVCVCAVEQDDDECLGFASLPEQVHRKAVKRGFDFTVMVVGLSFSLLITTLMVDHTLSHVCNYVQPEGWCGRCLLIRGL